MDSFDRLREALGTVGARHGLNTVVGPSIGNTVLLIRIAQAGTHQVERDYTADEAGHLGDLLAPPTCCCECATTDWYNATSRRRSKRTFGD